MAASGNGGLEALAGQTMGEVCPAIFILRFGIRSNHGKAMRGCIRQLIQIKNQLIQVCANAKKRRAKILSWLHRNGEVQEMKNAYET
ncbi:MAG: hypothetical protein E5V75_22900 [Mesorhizobium sp.]|nr:MAG: hypothetical protein E5V75_22900 [Mesorhizobium sp.]